MSSAGPSGSAEGGYGSESQIAKMILFIEQEAEEKVREIKVKASGDAIKEQGRMILAETQQINEIYKRKLKQAEVLHKIEHTSKINEHRLKLFKRREELVRDLFSKVQKKICDIVADRSAYSGTLRGLMLQAMYGMICTKISVRCRKADVNVVKELIPIVQKMYKEETEAECELVLDTTNFLPDNIFGGVVMSSVDGVIKVDNTLKEKLNLLYNRVPPNLSKELFGHFNIDEIPTFNA